MSTFLDEITNKETLKKLAGLGLEERDAAVYIALLGMDKAVGSSKIIAKTGLHGQYVYQSIGKLEEKGLIKHAVVNGRKKFSANSPERLRALAEEKKILADQVAEELRDLNARNRRQEFEIYQGDTAFIQHEWDLLEKASQGDFLDIIGGNSNRYVELFGERQMEKYERLRTEKEIRNRYIGTEAERTFLSIAKKKYSHFDYRILPGLKKGIVNTAIRPTSVSLCVYTDPVLTYTVSSEEVVESYRNFFETLWALGKE